MKLQFRLLQNERLVCSECGKLLGYSDNVYIVPDKDVMLFNCETCRDITVAEERLALNAGNRRVGR